MTATSINIAIAEVMGWARLQELDYLANTASGQQWKHIWGRNGRCLSEQELPNFHDDLNACAEMEATLNADDAVEYVRTLNWVHPTVALFDCGDNKDCLAYEAFQLICATAPQRCEAFLRVKGKWIED